MNFIQYIKEIVHVYCSVNSGINIQTIWLIGFNTLRKTYLYVFGMYLYMYISNTFVNDLVTVFVVTILNDFILIPFDVYVCQLANSRQQSKSLVPIHFQSLFFHRQMQPNVIPYEPMWIVLIISISKPNAEDLKLQVEVHVL